MNCLRCQHDNPPSARFCGSCGAGLGVACGVCGSLNSAGDRFCTECGQPLVSASVPRPHAYTPSHLAGRILNDRFALEGERKQVTILFADLTRSMEIIAARDPEDARKLLDAVLGRMMDAVHQYEGTVNQVLGDGIMALFGAPLAHEDHAVRACFAALRMQEAIERYAQDLRSLQGLDVQIRVGLNSGEVVVRSIGSDLHMDYTAVGQSAHLAARMEQLARPGTILATAETVRLAEGYVQVKALGNVPVKGLGASAEVYEVTGTGRFKSRLQASAARGFTPFIGRDAEMADLTRALEKASGGHGQVVTVVGEPGVGKSRLLWEFLHAPPTTDWLVLESNAVAHGRETVYLPVIGLLRRYFGAVDTDDAAVLSEKVQAVLGQDESDRFLSPLLALLGVPVSSKHWTALEPEQRRHRTLEAVRHLLVRSSQTQPLCLVIEDLHWVDQETQAVIDGIVTSVATARVLLLLSYRPEYQHGWANKSYYMQIRIDPFAGHTAEQFLDAVLGGRAELGPLRALLIERTEGNPFFLEESVRNLVETGVLTGERGAYRLARALETPRVPASVQAVLAARIDRLPPEDKRVLQAASVMGKDIPLPLLKEIVEVSLDDLTRILARLQAGEFLYEIRLFPEIEYSFKHALTLEVAFGSLLSERRRALDGAIVEAIERLYPDRPAEQLERLAHHALRGEVWNKAYTYCREAGAKAFAHSAHWAAATHFEHSLEALRHLPRTREWLERGIDVRFDLRYSLSPLGQYKKMLQVLTEGQQLAEELGDHRRLGLVSAFLTNLFTVRGELDRAVEAGQRAITIGESLDDLQLKALTNSNVSTAHFGRGEYRRAVDLARRNIGLLQGDLAFQRFGMALLPSVYSRSVMVWSLAEMGHFAEGLAMGEEALRLAETAQHPHSLIFACIGLGTLHVRKGHFDEAIRVLDRGHTLAQACGLPAVFLELAPPLASAYAFSGRVDDAMRLLEAAIAQAVTLRHPYGHYMRTGGMAEAHLCAGRAELALPLAQLFVEITRMVKGRGSHGWALRLLGEVLASSGPAEDHPASEAALIGALAIAEELGMPPLQGRCHLTLGAVRARTAPGAARDSLSRAAEIFQALDMAFWEAEAQRMLAGIG